MKKDKNQEEKAKWAKEVAELKQKLIDHEADHKLSDETKADFLSLVSHQLRTPLTVSLLNVEMLMAGYQGQLSVEQNNSLDEILVALKKMAKMLDIFSIISRIEMETFILHPKQLNLIEIVKKILLDFTEWHLRREVEVIFRPVKNLMLIEMDPDLVDILFRNLIANTTKNTPAGQVMTLSLTENKDGILFKLTDAGPGILLEEQSKIFEKSYRGPHVSKDEWGGSGLDLYIAKKIIDRCDGKIWFESEEGKGTTYFVLFPKRKVIKKIVE